jgi:hypothetical protein
MSIRAKIRAGFRLENPAVQAASYPNALAAPQKALQTG